MKCHLMSDGSYKDSYNVRKQPPHDKKEVEICTHNFGFVYQLHEKAISIWQIALFIGVKFRDGNPPLAHSFHRSDVRPRLDSDMLP
jgi:hypothetical protein